MDHDILVLVKPDGEQYTFKYLKDKKRSVSNLMFAFNHYARNPELSFSWKDAVALSAIVNENRHVNKPSR